jgi:hypothetical protein
MRQLKRILGFSFLFQMLFFHSLLAGTVKIVYSGSFAKDARITSVAPGFNGGNDIWGNVTYFTSNDNIARTYFQLEIPSFIKPEIANTITSSVFKVYFSGLQSGPFSISLNEVTSSWEENNICWTIRPQHNPTPEDTLTLNQENVWVEFNITNLVINWISGEKYNYGFVLKPLIEYPPVQDLTVLWTSDYPDSSFRPILEITSPELPDTVVTWIITSVEQDNLIEISNFQLSQNYPNPFNPNTIIKYSIAKESFVTIKVYDILGKEIATLVDERKLRGNYSMVFNSNNLSSGIYYYRLISGTYSETKKMIVLK